MSLEHLLRSLYPSSSLEKIPDFKHATGRTGGASLNPETKTSLINPKIQTKNHDHKNLQQAELAKQLREGAPGMPADLGGALSLSLSLSLSCSLSLPLFVPLSLSLLSLSRTHYLTQIE